MHRIPLGRTGLTVSDTCMGTMTFGNQTGIEDAHRQLDMAVDHGIDFLDTAEMYPVNPVTPQTRGRTEEFIGAWLSKRGRRDDLVIATKISGPGSPVFEGGSPAISPERLRSACEESLRRLGTDVIDLYQLHWPNRGHWSFRRNWDYQPKAASEREVVVADMLATLETIGDLVAEGKIRHFGLSNETAWGMAQWLRLAELHNLPSAMTIQNEHSLLARLVDTDLAEVCALEDLPMLAYSPLAAGLLTGKYAGNVRPEGSRLALNGDLGGRMQPLVFGAVAAYRALALEWGLEPVQMALAWLRQRPFPCIPILGATTAEQLALALPATELTLSAEQLAAINQTHRAHPMPY